MFKIILFTHGSLCEGLLNSAELITGTQENIETFSLTSDADLSEIKEKVSNSILNSNQKKEEVLVLTDLSFGTPFNIMMQLYDGYKFNHITGVNLPILLEVISNRNPNNMNLYTQQLVSIGKNSIADFNEHIKD